jgi:copper transport protein
VVTRAFLLCAIVALVAPAAASAHATLLRTVPANGAVLRDAPSAVRVEFDDRVRVAPGNAAVANATGASVLGGKPRASGDVLAIPLRPDLAGGVYSVRWSIVSDDGHREQGVLAFGIGSGAATPTSVLGAAAQLTWSDILLRTLWYLGLLAGAGATVFGLLARDLLDGSLHKPLAQLLFFALLVAFLGGSGILHSAPPGTRFELVMKVALTVALAGGAAAALAPAIPRLLPPAGACALALLAAPTLSGHSLDRNQPRVLAPVVDLAHEASAAVWLGGLLALVLVLPRATGDGPRRLAVVRRFSTLALVAVLVLGASGLVRALTELSHVSQVWSTSYGRALIVKTVLFAPLLGLGWLNRTVLVGAFARLRRSALVELALLAGIVIAVAVLTELRPGKETARAASPLAVGAATSPALPPRDAVVAARELGANAVAVGRLHGRAYVTLLGPDGTGLDGRDVRVDGVRATPCGSGCYRAPAGAGAGALQVRVDDRTVTFALPARAPDASARLKAITRAYRASRTIVFDEKLASTPANATTTRFRVAAPHRLEFVMRGGATGIVIGDRRWDREAPGKPFVESPQTPLDVTQPYWTAPTNAREVAPGVITFLDRRLPAWFRLDVTGPRPVRLEMTAAAHFMVDRYVAFDGPVVISPPSR